MRLALHWKIVIALVLGVIVGLALNQAWTSQTWSAIGVGDAAAFLKGQDSAANQDASAAAHAARTAAKAAEFVGAAFVRLLRFVAVPMILFSLIAATAGMGDLGRLGRVSTRTAVLFISTLLAAILIALVAANLARPGSFISPEARAALTAGASSNPALAAAEKTAADYGFWTFLTNCIPTNPFDALARGDLMQVVVLSLFLGACLAVLPRQNSEPILRLCDAFNTLFLRVVAVVMRLAPFAVFCLIARTTSQMGLDVVKALSVFCLVVVVCLAIQIFLVYVPLVAVLARVGPARFLRGISEAMLVAFSTSSSSATLPVTLRCVETNLDVPRDLATFVCAAGATVNMGGTAMYQAIVAVFIAQMYGIDLSFSQQLTIVMMACFASIGAPGVPSGGIVLLVGVLHAVGLPVEGIAVILGVDRLLDMCRTVVNITGDAAAAVVVARWEKP